MSEQLIESVLLFGPDYESVAVRMSLKDFERLYAPVPCGCTTCVKPLPMAVTVNKASWVQWLIDKLW